MTNLKKLEDEEILELENSLKKYLPHHKMYQRVLAVKMVKQGCTRIEVGNYMNVDRQTVGRWVKKYDENGIEGLEPDYSNCGRNCKLSDEQLSEFKEIITNPNEHYTIKKAMKLIRKKIWHKIFLQASMGNSNNKIRFKLSQTIFNISTISR